jgi:prepilin-type N-terminal cleavage/methylation domain-containing protein
MRQNKRTTDELQTGISKREIPSPILHYHPTNAQHGFSLIEILISLAIFSVILAGIYSAYISQLGHSTREYKISEAEMELGIAKSIIERDIAMTGFGLAYDYGSFGFNPLPLAATNANPNTLTLMGTALGTKSRAAGGWTYITDVPSGLPTFQTWTDARENVRIDASDSERNDLIIIMEPSTRTLLGQGEAWRFKYNGSGANLTTYQTQGATAHNTPFATPTTGSVIYGISKAGTDPVLTQPYYAVVYSPVALRLNLLVRAKTFTGERHKRIANKWRPNHVLCS